MTAIADAMKKTDVPAIVELRRDLDRMDDQWSAALPPDITPEKFKRVAMTAIQTSPNLMRCTKQSLFTALIQCATDGLIPDGREAAIVPYNEGDDGARSDVARYMPMVGGIRKRVFKARALAKWEVQVVQEGDEFDYQLGDQPHIHHKPALRGGRDRPVIAAYSIATFPNGSQTMEVMNIDQLMDVRAKSRAKKGPWADKTFFPEMCRKTVARLHSKQLPMSSDLLLVINRDDDMYVPHVAAHTAAPRQIASTQAALDHFAEKSSGSSKDATPAAEAPREPASVPQGDDGSRADKSQANSITEYREMLNAVLDEAHDADQLYDWFFSEPQRILRAQLGMTIRDYEALRDLVKAKIEQLGGRKKTPA